MATGSRSNASPSTVCSFRSPQLMRKGRVLRCWRPACNRLLLHRRESGSGISRGDPQKARADCNHVRVCGRRPGTTHKSRGPTHTKIATNLNIFVRRAHSGCRRSQTFYDHRVRPNFHSCAFMSTFRPRNRTPSPSRRSRCSRAESPRNLISPPAPSTRCQGNPNP